MRFVGASVRVETPLWWLKARATNPNSVCLTKRSYGSCSICAGFLRHEDEKLAAAQVRRVIAALDEKCRDVEF